MAISPTPGSCPLPFLAASPTTPRTLAHSLPGPVCSQLLEAGSAPRGGPGRPHTRASVNEMLSNDPPAHEPTRLVRAFRKVGALEAYAAHKAERGRHHPMFIQTHDMGKGEQGKPIVAPNTSTFHAVGSPLYAVRETGV